MAYRKIEILLPLYHNPDKNGTRTKIGDREFSETYQDLVNRFGGCTINPTLQSGGWINPETGQEIKDVLTIYWIICEESEENTIFLKGFKDILKKRFRQDNIMMFSMPINKF